MDLEDFSSVSAAASAFKKNFDGRCDGIIMNAGILSPSPTDPPYNTETGLCRTFQTNHLGHFVLFKELERNLIQTGYRLLQDTDPTTDLARTARVVVVSSDAHRQTKSWEHVDQIYDGCFPMPQSLGAIRTRIFKNYGLSKLANILFAYQVQRRMRDIATKENPTFPVPVIAVSCHPGNVDTGILNGVVPSWLQRVIYLFSTSVEESAEQSVFLATSKVVEEKTGGVPGKDGYWERSRPTAPSPLGFVDLNAEDLWDMSEAFVSAPLTRDRVQHILALDVDRIPKER